MSDDHKAGGGHGGFTEKVFTWVLIIIFAVVAYNLLMATITGTTGPKLSTSWQPISPIGGRIGPPTGNSCDRNNPQPYQRNGQWFICK